MGRGRTAPAPATLVAAWELTRLLAERRGRFEPALEILGRGRAAFALVANGDPYTYAGPLPISVAPEARFELGLDLVRPARRLAGDAATLFAYVAAGPRPAEARDVVYGHDLDRIEVVCDRPMPLQADGEDLGDVTSAIFEAERGAALVLV